jgi:hypothetical protein
MTNLQIDSIHSGMEHFVELPEIRARDASCPATVATRSRTKLYEGAGLTSAPRVRIAAARPSLRNGRRTVRFWGRRAGRGPPTPFYSSPANCASSTVAGLETLPPKPADTAGRAAKQASSQKASTDLAQAFRGRGLALSATSPVATSFEDGEISRAREVPPTRFPLQQD